VPPARRRRKPSHVKKCNRSSQLPEGERNACRRVLDRGINPDGVRNQIEGGVIQTVSRTLIEELKFDRSRVTSLDWSSYPILTFPDVPSAICSAIFDATGARLRSVPFKPQDVKAALARV
jgi:CO/xanthine dehydrogenase Mo-binding subunit